MRRPSPALVVAVIALIVAMSGTSYAVTQLPRNSVGAKQIKKNAVTSAKIKDGTIATADLATATRDELKGQRGETGPQGPTGPAGPSSGGSVARVLGASLGTIAPLVSLGSTASASRSGPVTVATRSRLQISASVNLEKEISQAAQAGRVECYVQWSVAGSEAWSDTTAISMGSASLPDTTTTAVPSGTVFWATISIDDHQVVEAGSYDVRLLCQKIGAADVIADYAGINVVAIPAS